MNAGATVADHGLSVRRGTRTAVALYVALALHAIALLFLLLVPTPQIGSGPGVGLTLAGEGSVLVPDVAPAVSAPPTAMPASDRDRAPSVPKSPPQVRTRMSEVAPEAPDMTPTFASGLGTDRVPGIAHTGGGGSDTYFVRLRAHLARFRREIPGPSASGRAEVRFTVRPDGRVAGARLERSSGFDALDAEALALFDRAQPLPRPPGGEPLELVVPIYVGG